MLKCKDIAERTSDYLNIDTPWYCKLGWYMHIFMCGPCRRFVNHFKLSVKVSSTMAQQQIPKSEAEEISNQVIKECSHKLAPK